MREKEQRVLELNKIDSKAVAWLVGYQNNWWHGIKERWTETVRHNTEQGILHVDVKSFPENVSVLKFMHDELQEYIVNSSFDYGKKTDVQKNDKEPMWEYVNFAISKKSKSYVGNKLVPVKKDFWKYELLGLYMKIGFVNNKHNGDIIEFCGHKNTMQMLEKQLIMWGDIFVETYDNKVEPQLMTLKIKSGDSIKAFIDLLPEDYLNIFKDNDRVKSLLKNKTERYKQEHI